MFQYYIFKNGKHSYIRKKNIQIARAIAQKDYNKKDEHVRSKSEVIIADTLGSKRIPYHYDIILGKNLILTMETRKQQLNTKDIEKVIEALLVWKDLRVKPEDDRDKKNPLRLKAQRIYQD